MLQTRVEAISQEIATCMQEIDVANVEIQKHTDCINSLDSSEEDCREKIKSLDEQIEKLEKQYIFLLAPTFEEPIKRGVANERYISTVAHIVADISVEVAHATAVTPSDIGFAEELGLMAESGYTDAKTFERDLEFALLVNEITIVQPEAVVNVIGESQPLSILIALTANLFDEL
jgi:hypothetical protein